MKILHYQIFFFFFSHFQINWQPVEANPAVLWNTRDICKPLHIQKKKSIPSLDLCNTRQIGVFQPMKHLKSSCIHFHTISQYARQRALLSSIQSPVYSTQSILQLQLITVPITDKLRPEGCLDNSIGNL